MADRDPGLVFFVTDAELIRALNLPEDIGRRALAALDAGVPNTRKFPGKDPRFGKRRFFPAVAQWLYDYYGVRLSEQSDATPSVGWVEHWDGKSYYHHPSGMMEEIQDGPDDKAHKKND
jgi:hypothetical protein